VKTALLVSVVHSAADQFWRPNASERGLWKLDSGHPQDTGGGGEGPLFGLLAARPRRCDLVLSAREPDQQTQLLHPLAPGQGRRQAPFYQYAT